MPTTTNRQRFRLFCCCFRVGITVVTKGKRENQRRLQTSFMRFPSTVPRQRSHQVQDRFKLPIIIILSAFIHLSFWCDFFNMHTHTHITHICAQDTEIDYSRSSKDKHRDRFHKERSVEKISLSNNMLVFRLSTFLLWCLLWWCECL